MSNYIKSIVPFVANRSDFMDNLESSPVAITLAAKAIMPEHIDTLRACMECYPSVDPKYGNRTSIGYAMKDTYQLSTDGRSFHLRVEHNQKLLPNDVVKKRLEEKVRNYFEEVGEYPSRTERKCWKDEIEMEMLATALVRSRTYTVSFVVFGDEICVSVCNAATKLAEEIFEFVYKTLISNSFSPYKFFATGNQIANAGHAIGTFFSDHFLGINRGVELSQSVKLKDPDKGAVSITDYDGIAMQAAYDEMFCNGYPVVAIDIKSAISGESEIYMSVDHKLRVSKISMSLEDLHDRYGLAVDEEAEGVELFLAEALIYTSEVMELIGLMRKITAS